ncbi:MAG TPA: hypothetical protein VLA76_06475 [Candidatus Angelobacter sp.]|nr:hypothetical protein [Candidatus Angelobacter sp.]
MILHPGSRARRLGPIALPGGDRLAAGLAVRLDDEWHWFRAVAPGGIEPIDGVLVGPGGTFALTQAGERGRFARRNGHWYRWNRSTESWVPWEPAPITAARLAARRLSLYLDRAALPAMVTAVLVPRSGMSVEAGPGEHLGVIAEPDAERIAAHAAAEERLSQPQVDRIVALLDPRQPLPRLAPSTPRG